METYDLVNNITALQRNLMQSVKALQKAGIKKSQAESNYRMSLSEEILLEREKGTPVTILSDIVRGKRHIAKLRLERDISETDYAVCLEHINSVKLQLRLVENQLSREWGMARREV